MIGFAVNSRMPGDDGGMCLEIAIDSSYSLPRLNGTKVRLHMPPDAMYCSRPDTAPVLDHIEKNNIAAVVVHPCDAGFVGIYEEHIREFAAQLSRYGTTLEIENGVPVRKRGFCEAFADPAELGNFIRSVGGNVGMVLDIGKAALYYEMKSGYSTGCLEMLMHEYSDIIASYHLCEKSYMGGADAVIGIREKGRIGTLQLLPRMRGNLIIEANQKPEEAYKDAKWLQQSYLQQESQLGRTH